MKTTTLQPIADDPAIRGENDELVRLQLRKLETETQVTELLNTINEKTGDRERAEERILSEAARVAAGSAPDFRSVRDVLGRQVQECKQEIRLLESAIAIRRNRIHALIVARTKAACVELAPRHREITRKKALALLELIRLEKAERDFYNELRDAGFEGVTLPSMAVPTIDVTEVEIRNGELRLNGSYGEFFSDCIRLDFMTKGEIIRGLSSGK